MRLATQAKSMTAAMQKPRIAWDVGFMANACVSDRRQRETVSTIKTSVEAASCSLDAMVRRFVHVVSVL
jgi:hypothetical protein